MGQIMLADRLRDAVAAANGPIVFLTGAGISAAGNKETARSLTFRSYSELTL
jgi:NAD-dependent SIR2 family protein deacetylase